MELSSSEILAISLFIVVYFFIISELVHRTVIALPVSYTHLPSLSLYPSARSAGSLRQEMGRR